MKTDEALKITGSLSKPSKMPGWAYGLPAKECKTGSKLVKIPGSVCYDCYALRAAMFLKLSRMRNTNGWQLYAMNSGLELWQQ